MKKITIEDYNPQWKLQFQALQSYLQQHLEGLFLSIEHVGSTAVEGLAAKPIIDLDIIIEQSDEKLQLIIQKLEEVGYQHRGDLGIEGRHAFKRISDKVPFQKQDSPHSWQNHHLYVCKEGITSLNNHLILRNHLRKNAQSRTEYGALKKYLAANYPHDIDMYVELKTAFIVAILTREGLSKAEVEGIIQQNKAPE